MEYSYASATIVVVAFVLVVGKNVFVRASLAKQERVLTARFAKGRKTKEFSPGIYSIREAIQSFAVSGGVEWSSIKIEVQSESTEIEEMSFECIESAERGMFQITPNEAIPPHNCLACRVSMNIRSGDKNRSIFFQFAPMLAHAS